MGLKETGNHSETEEFLRNASEPGPDHHDDRQHRNDETAETEAFNLLKKNNPRDNTPPEGVDADVMEHIKQWKTFCALAVQVDASDASGPVKPLSQALESLFSELAKDNKGIWFQWRSQLYALVLPDIAAEQARENGPTPPGADY